METPLRGEGVIALMPMKGVGEPSSPPPPAGRSSSAVEEPILIFLLSQKAIKAELEWLHRAALALVADRGGNVELLFQRYRFLFAIYEHHCNAEDEWKVDNEELLEETGNEGCMHVLLLLG